MSRFARIFVLSAPAVFVAAAALGQTFGVKKKRPRFDAFGSVVMNHYSEAKGQAPVRFQHWVHRARFTCRLCHVDLGFAMTAGETDITEADNNEGLYCGACHDGKTAFAPETKKAPSGVVRNCDRCHSVGKAVEFTVDFREFKRGLPRERFGNGIDWIEAEKSGKVELVDYIEGASIRHDKIRDPEDIELDAKEPNMPNIVFSHAKHAIWNGCESCHPDIFPVKRDAQPYSMQEIFSGKFCGACHDKVAFPNIDCQRCHTKAVY